MRRDNRLISYFVILILCLLILVSSSNAQEKISSEGARKYIGHTKTVCGVVASTFYAIRSKGRPTFLNLDRPYPNQIFTIVIWGSDRRKFDDPFEIFFKGKRVCVTGLIKTYRGKPQIVVRDPSEIHTEE